MSENPYASPQSIALENKGQSGPKVSILRGGMWALVWGGAAFVLAPLAGATARSIFLNDANKYKLSETFAQFNQLVGIGILLGILFSLSAIANYTPVVRVGFIRTLLWTLLAFLASSFLVVIGSTPFEWPLSPAPQRYDYQPTIAESLWNGAWCFSGTFLFTAYLLWRRIGMTASRSFASPTQYEVETEDEIK